MESSTAVPVHERATGSSTIADLIALAAEQHGDQPAIRFKRDGAWHDVGYAELGETVSEIGRPMSCSRARATRAAKAWLT